MNVLILAGIVLTGGTAAFDRLVRGLPHWLATALYASAAVMIIAGMIAKRRAA